MQESPASGMWGRYALFIILSFGYIFLAQRFFLPRARQQEGDRPGPVAQADKNKADKNKDAKAAEEPKGKAAPAKGKDEADKESVPPAKPGAKEGPKAGPEAKQTPKPPAKSAPPKVPDTFITLGSLDPDSPYRMLVTFTNRGAAIKRIELNSPRFHDMDDRSGYLGHVVVDESAPGPGCTVQVVGQGTPAQKAGLTKGDVIEELDGREVAGFKSLRPESKSGLRDVLAKTRPGQEVILKVRRKDSATKKDEVLDLPVTLRRRPLQVVCPRDEEGAPPSFSLTLCQIGDLKTQAPEAVEGQKKTSEARLAFPKELEGVDLRTENWQVEYDREKAPARVTFRHYLPTWGLEVVKTFTLAEVPANEKDDSTLKAYHLGFDVQIVNKGTLPREVAYQIDGPSGLPIEGYWYASKVYRGWTSGLRDVMALFRAGTAKFDLTTYSSKRIVSDNPGLLPPIGQVRFIGVDAQYFAAMLIPERDAQQEAAFGPWEVFHYGKVDSDFPTTANSSFSLQSEAEKIAPEAQGGTPLAQRFLIFAGPKKPALLDQYGLGDIVYYGWYGWVAKPLLLILHTFYRIIPNYGVAIILLTVLVRGCMYPLSRKQAQSAQKMQELQPELKRIHEQYKNNFEARNKAQAELFRKHKFHPMGGCLLLFLQLPIFVGLYRALMVDVELRQAPLITEGLGWATNLAAPDMLFDWSGFMPEFVTKGTGILGLGPYFNLLPVLTIFMFLWQQKKFTPAPADEKAAMQMKVMKYMMVFMGILFFKVASGLCLYFIVSSLWSIAERKYLPKMAPSRPSPVPVRPARPAPPAPTGRDGSPKRKKKSRRK